MSFDAAHPNPVIAEKLARIYALHSVESDFRLTRSPYNELLERLGNPHLHLPPVIHLAGTNGKGSTQAFLKSIYQAAGYKVHAYTSPHLIKFNERITLANIMMSDEQLDHYLDMVDAANQGLAVTFFEYTTALAFKAFADSKADICLLETGLGGRLDCTNIIPTAAATVITSIGYDHMDYLGNSIEEIAGEKAGIMKQDIPCIIAPQEYPQTHNVFLDKAHTLNCPIHFAERRQATLPMLSLQGDHQFDNASTAIQTIETLQSIFPVEAEAIAFGLGHTQWLARMEHIIDSPIARALPPHFALWFDCGHNQQGAQTIATQLRKWKTENAKRPIHMILGLAKDKDAKAFVGTFSEYINSLTCVDLKNARNPQSANDLQQRLSPDFPCTTAPSLTQAIQGIPMSEPATIIICGSLYLYHQTK